MADYENVSWSGWSLRATSVGGSDWGYQQDRATCDIFVAGPETTNFRVGIDCDNETQKINSIDRIVLKFTTTIANPVACIIEVPAISILWSNTFDRKLRAVDWVSGSDATGVAQWPRANYGFGTPLSYDTVAGRARLLPAPLRFRLNAAGLTKIATPGTHYFALVHENDDSGSLNWVGSQNSYIQVDNPATENDNQPIVRVFGGNISEVQQVSPSPVAGVHSTDIAGTEVVFIRTNASSPDINFSEGDIEWAGTGSSASYFMLNRFDLSSLAGKTCVYARFDVLARPDTANETDYWFKAGIIRHDIDFVGAGGTYYRDTTPWADRATLDMEYDAFFSGYGDGLSITTVTTKKFIEAYGATHADWLTLINNVLSGTDAYPANKLTIGVRSTVTDELRIINGSQTDPTDEYAGPTLTLGFGAAAAPAEYIVVGVESIVGLESIAW